MRVRVAVFLTLLGAVVALTGCRSDPSVAAYVGSVQYSKDKVTAIADEADEKLADLAKQAGVARPERPVTEQQVVTALVGRDVLKALAQEKNINPVSVDANQMAQRVQVPPDTEYVRVLTEKDGYRLGLLKEWPSAKTTSDAALREAYDNLVKGGYPSSFQQLKVDLPDSSIELVGRSVSLRGEVQAEARKLGVAVNPRFGPAVVNVLDTTQNGQVIPIITVSLNATESGVRDLS